MSVDKYILIKPSYTHGDWRYFHGTLLEISFTCGYTFLNFHGKVIVKVINSCRWIPIKPLYPYAELRYQNETMYGVSLYTWAWACLRKAIRENVKIQNKRAMSVNRSYIHIIYKTVKPFWRYAE